MIYILLPTVNISIYDFIECTSDEKIPKPLISNSLSHYLYHIKNRIDTYGRDWDDFRKYTNPY